MSLQTHRCYKPHRSPGCRTQQEMLKSCFSTQGGVTQCTQAMVPSGLCTLRVHVRARDILSSLVPKETNSPQFGIQIRVHGRIYCTGCGRSTGSADLQPRAASGGSVATASHSKLHAPHPTVTAMTPTTTSCRSLRLCKGTQDSLHDTVQTSGCRFRNLKIRLQKHNVRPIRSKHTDMSHVEDNPFTAGNLIGGSVLIYAHCP